MMMLRKTRMRIAALEAHNARLELLHDEKDDRIGDLLAETDRLRNNIRAARAVASRARTSYMPPTMPYQHLTSVVLVLDGKDPLA